MRENVLQQAAWLVARNGEEVARERAFTFSRWHEVGCPKRDFWRMVAEAISVETSRVGMEPPSAPKPLG